MGAGFIYRLVFEFIDSPKKAIVQKLRLLKRCSPYTAFGERGGRVVEPWTPVQRVRGSIPSSAVLCLSAKTHLLPEKYW